MSLAPAPTSVSMMPATLVTSRIFTVTRLEARKPTTGEAPVDLFWPYCGCSDSREV